MSICCTVAVDAVGAAAGAGADGAPDVVVLVVVVVVVVVGIDHSIDRVLVAFPVPNSHAVSSVL